MLTVAIIFTLLGKKPGIHLVSYDQIQLLIASRSRFDFPSLRGLAKAI